MTNDRARGNSRHNQSRKPRFEDKPTFGSGEELLALMNRIDGASYGAYKRALGTWDFGDYKVIFDRLQSDPYAPPSAVRVQYRRDRVALPADLLRTSDQKLATADFLARTFHGLVRGGSVSIARCGQEILERSYASVHGDYFELRISVRMPARGRTILGRQAKQIFADELPKALRELFAFDDPDYYGSWLQHLHTLEDHRALTEAVESRGLVAFIADGALLARESGISEKPMLDGVPFSSPESLQIEVELPHRGAVTGMGIPAGITLLVGGGYHGKSTVLSAIERSVYPHVPGDGRERVAALSATMKVRAADGRPVTKVDVSPFINHLPTGADTKEFSTQNASGSTSQAASIIEALQAGSKALLLDEDTSATNLLIRDARMRELVVAKQEPITPLIDRIEGMRQQTGTSVVMVMGGSSAYLNVADLVLQMESYHCVDVTDKARDLVQKMPVRTDSLPGFPALRERIVLPTAPSTDRPKTKAAGVDRIEIDRQGIDVRDVEQIVDPGQTEAIAYAVRGITTKLADSEMSIEELADIVEAELRSGGLDALSLFGARRYPSSLVMPRRIDIIAGVNRLRTLRIR